MLHSARLVVPGVIALKQVSLLECLELLCCEVVVLFLLLFSWNMISLLGSTGQKDTVWWVAILWIYTKSLSQLGWTSWTSWCDHRLTLQVVDPPHLFSLAHGQLDNLYHCLNKPIGQWISGCWVENLKLVASSKFLKFNWHELPSMVCKYIGWNAMLREDCLQ